MSWWRRWKLRRAYRRAEGLYRELVRVLNACPPELAQAPDWAAEVQKAERDLEALLIELARRDPEMAPELRAWLAARPEPRAWP